MYGDYRWHPRSTYVVFRLARRGAPKPSTLDLNVQKQVSGVMMSEKQLMRGGPRYPYIDMRYVRLVVTILHEPN